MDKTCTVKFLVHTYEVDFRARALPLTLLNYLQDAAGEHAARLGFSVLDLLKRDLTWLLSRYHIRVRRYPVVRRDGLDHHLAVGQAGDFRPPGLRDRGRAAAGRSARRRAPGCSGISSSASRPGSRRIFPTGSTLDRRALADAFGPLPVCPAGGRELPFRVEMQDIDFNNHVNHPVYIQWALETAPETVLRTLAPVEIEVAYKGEALYGEEVVSRIDPVEEGPRPGLPPRDLPPGQGNGAPGSGRPGGRSSGAPGHPS